MKYIFKYPARLIWALFVTVLMLVTIVVCLVGEFIWKFKAPWTLDGLREPELWHYITGENGINLREWKSAFHWALRIGEIHPYTGEKYKGHGHK